MFKIADEAVFMSSIVKQWLEIFSEVSFAGFGTFLISWIPPPCPFEVSFISLKTDFHYGFHQTLSMVLKLVYLDICPSNVQAVHSQSMGYCLEFS
jgi:hypothetical protein